MKLTTILLMLATALAAPPPPPQNAAAVQGRVVHARTGEPIPGAQVTLTDGTSTSSDPDPIATTTSGADGAFSFEVSNSGVYAVTAMSNGFGRERTRLAVGEGDVVQDLLVRIAPASAISGRVVGTSGQPLVEATVSLIRPGYSAGGAPRESTVTSVRTNDRGEYRLFWLSPGRYYVMAEGRNGGPFSFDNARSNFENGVRDGRNAVPGNGAGRYYPGVPDISLASVIQLEEGTEVRGIDFTLPPQQTYSIRGRLIDPRTGEPPGEAWITLRRSGGSSWSASWYDAATGQFEIPSLEPGPYGLTVSLESMPFLGTFPPGTPLTSAEVLLEGSNADNLELAVRERPVITGRVQIEGDPPEGATLDGIRVRLTRADPLAVSFGNASATLETDATFSLPTMEVGEYRVTMSGLPEGFYLKQALLNGSDVLNLASEFSQSANLEVLVSGRAGQVEGQVLDGEMRPVAAVEAILIPDVRRHLPELYGRTLTDAEGRFAFQSIPPGDYTIFAWEHIEANAYFDERALGPFQEVGVPVRVEESSRVSVDVGLIPGEIAP